MEPLGFFTDTRTDPHHLITSQRPQVQSLDWVSTYEWGAAVNAQSIETFKLIYEASGPDTKNRQVPTRKQNYRPIFLVNITQPTNSEN
jgi:hypothetical protein